MANGPVYPHPVAELSVTIGGQNAIVQYAGAAPTLVAGVLQINVVVPSGLQGNQPVVVTIGGKSSPVGVTVAIRGTTTVPVPPPPTDLAQSVSNWAIQYLTTSGATAAGGAADDTSPAEFWTAPLPCTSTVRRPIPSCSRATRRQAGGISRRSRPFRLRCSPTCRLGRGPPAHRPSALLSANGSLTMSPIGASPADPSYNGYITLTAPLAGNATWRATPSGQFSIQNVTGIQINLNTSITDWAVILNAMFVK